MTGSQEAFLAANGWAGATAVPLAGDASARVYTRLRLGPARAILMRAPPADCAAFDAFVTNAARLRALGLSAPEVLATAPGSGLMLLEDLGDTGFHRLAADLHEASLAATDVLVHLARHAPGWGLSALTPAEMAEMTRIALPAGAQAEAAFAAMADVFGTLFSAPLVPALRDVHAENLIWLPDRAGLARVGLLDFQDAVLAPLGYDLVSYIHDARRDVDPEIAGAMTARYVAALGLDPARFAAEAAALSLQRNLRILGVFRRLARVRGKPAYLAHLPRVFGHVEDALAHPALGDLRRALAPLMDRIAP